MFIIEGFYCGLSDYLTFFYPLQSVAHSQLCDIQWSKRVFDSHGANTTQRRPLKNTTQNMERPSQSANPRPDELIDTQAGLKYWQDISNDVDGMLGGIPALAGFSSVSRIDIQGSRTFLARLGIGVKAGRKPVTSALDGGAGCVLCFSSSMLKIGLIR